MKSHDAVKRHAGASCPSAPAVGFKISGPKQATHEILIWTSIASHTVQRTYFFGHWLKLLRYHIPPRTLLDAMRQGFRPAEEKFKNTRGAKSFKRRAVSRTARGPTGSNLGYNIYGSVDMYGIPKTCLGPPVDDREHVLSC